MRILAIESSAVTASVAILEDDTLVAEYTINHKMTHSQTLLPMIDEIFSMVQLKPDDVDVIAVSGIISCISVLHSIRHTPSE